MKITVFAAGSRGDIQPCLVLSKGLQDAGYQVRLAAPENFAAFAFNHGVSFIPLRGDVQKIMDSDTVKKFMEKGGSNPLKSIRVMRSLAAPVVMSMAQDAYSACLDADALICLGVFSSFGYSISEALRIPMIQIEPAPLLPTRAFPAPSWPIQRDLGGLHNYLSGRVMLQVVWLWYHDFLKDFRHTLGLSIYTSGRFFQVLRSTPMLGAYSPSLIPHPADWPDSVHVTGYLFLEGEGDWQPPADLLAFLEAGDPPVYIGFGSMAGRNPEGMARVVSQALVESGQRGLLLTGWGGLRAELVAKYVFVLQSAPHSWLFPRMAAVVHHGGAGTTAEGLRAGIPSVIVPFAFDQPFWGARLNALGLGPQPVPVNKLTISRLAGAISQAVSDQGMRERARVTGEAIRSEDGLANAVDHIRRYLGNPGVGEQEVKP